MQIDADFRPSATTLSDRNIVITGATTQPGRTLAAACCRAGGGVILIDKNQAQLAQLYDQLVTDAAIEPAIMPLDLSELDHNSCRQVALTLAQEYPRLDGLVHCALWSAPLAPLELTQVDSWWRVLENQLIAPWLLTKTLLPLLKKSTAARVIFTTHACGRHGKAYWGVFAAAFAAINNMIQTWNDEFENEPIDFFSIDPGPIKSEWRTTLYPAENKQELTSADDPDVLNRYLVLLAAASEISAVQ